MNKKGWEPLRPGDIVDLVAPGSACSRKELNASLRVLKSWGYTPRVPENLFSGHKILAHSDEWRLKNLKKAIEAKDSKAVWCVRGGYGSLRLVPELKTIRAPKSPKIFLGYSDITTLHSYFYQNWGWPTLHSPLFDSLGSDRLALSQKNRLRKILSGELSEVVFKNIKPFNVEAKKVKSLKGYIVGGNLCVINSSVGTINQVKTRGHLLFLEDLGERPHRVDRMLVQMSQSGVFKGCKGILLGDFLIGSQDKHLLWNDVLTRFSQTCGVPVFKGLPVGHGKVQRTLPLGCSAEIVPTQGSKDHFSLNVKTGVQ